ncbi:MAG: type 4a pilus biogenesis protein PilO [Thermoanaerobaculia bacterium]|nr:type 4a pilus biogenesis protein PilO [Thermoanaerobaculia bacterium]
MAIQTGLEGKPWYYGLIAGLFVAFALYYGAHVWLLKPKQQTLAAQESQLAGLQAKIQEGRAAKVQLPRFREEVRRLELELDRLLRILPSRRNTPELLRRVRDLTEQGDFELLRFTPGGEVPKDFFSEWPIDISLRGGYHNLALFFDRVGRFSRIINIENLRVSATNDGSPHTLSATFQAKTFVYRDAE